jgi:DNA polymerase-3 subunit beta
LRIFSTDSSLEFTGEYPAQVEEEGLVGVQGRNFHELIRKLPPGEIGMRLDAASGNLLITQGSRKYKLPTSDKSWFQNFSPFPENGVVVWSGDFLQELIDRVAYCISDEDTMQAMACMYFRRTPNPGSRLRPKRPSVRPGRVFQRRRPGHAPGRGHPDPEKVRRRTQEMAHGRRDRTGHQPETPVLPGHGQARDLQPAAASYYQYPDYATFVSKLDGEDVSSCPSTREELQGALERVAIFNTDTNRCAYFSSSPRRVVASQPGPGVRGGSENPGRRVHRRPQKKIAFPTRDIVDILGHFHSPG